MTEIPQHLMDRAQKARHQAQKVVDGVQSVATTTELLKLQEDHQKLRQMTQQLLDIFIEGGYTEPQDEELINNLCAFLSPQEDPLLTRIKEALHEARRGGLGSAKTEDEAVRKMALSVYHAIKEG